jgi:hypothetical protein
MKCRSKNKRHWATARAAHTALARIQDSDDVRAYTPTGVLRCSCGEFVLTSSDGKRHSTKHGRRGSRPTRRNR